MEKKICTRKPFTEEEKEKNRVRARIWGENNREKAKLNSKIWYKNNKKKASKTNKIYREKNKELIAKKNKIYEKNKILTDKLFKLKHNVKTMISSSFKTKGFVKKSKTLLILGCSFDEFKLYLESKFEPWMNWDNKGKYNGELNYGWDIDYIIP